MSPSSISFYMFSMVFLVFGIVIYLSVGRGFCVDRRVRKCFSAYKISDYMYGSAGDSDVFSPCLKKDNGDISLVVEAASGNIILTYSVSVTGQLNKFRYLILVSKTTSTQNTMYGYGYFYRVAKYNKFYVDLNSGFINVPSDIHYLDESIEAIEVFNGYCYSFYRLPMFFGYKPIDRLAYLLKLKCEG